jgi:hypothetical protein
VAYFIIAIITFIGGAVLGFFASEPKRRLIQDEAERLRRLEQEISDRNQQSARDRQVILEKDAERLRQLEQKITDRNQQLARQRQETLDMDAERTRNAQAEIRESETRLANRQQALQDAITRNTGNTEQLNADRKNFDAAVISYKELVDENLILKTDLRNLDAHVRKIQLDRNEVERIQASIDLRVKELGSRYLKENVKWIGTSLNPNNFAACKQRLLDVIQRCQGIGYDLSQQEKDGLIANLKSDFESVVREAFKREEQARIKAQIREEQLRQAEIDRELRQLERERDAIATALAKALSEAADQNSEEIERLKARLAEAEGKKRAISQAQITKSGHVYVISNIGSFGEDVFKVGMTRRLQPLDRVTELGDASVPFPFDVHMMICSDNAPGLENALHRELHKLRVNKANPRKEYFKTTIDELVRLVTENHGIVEYVADPEALQFRQSQTMSDEDEEFIEQVYAEFDNENHPDADEL